MTAYHVYRDAEDAVKYRDGYNWDGCTLRVEFARGGRGAFRGGFRGGRGGFRGRDFGDRGRYGPPSRRSDYRVKITGLYVETKLDHFLWLCIMCRTIVHLYNV